MPEMHAAFDRRHPDVEHHAAALLDRHIVPHPDEELVGYLPVGSLPRCSRCERPSDDLLDRAHGERICGACRDRERAAYEAETGQCFRGCGYALAWHPQPRSAADECPTEADARERSGAQ